MAIPIEMFKQTNVALEDADDIELVRRPDIALLDLAFKGFSKEAYEGLFQKRQKMPVPPAIAELLALPQSLECVWRGTAAAGEFRLLKPGSNAERRIDPSYAGMTEVPVTEMVILDQVTDIAGPHFVLYSFDTVESEGLYLFDGREAGRLTLSPNAYVDALALGGGFDSWQFLFSDLPITLDRKKAMLASFAAIQQILPDRDYSIFEEALESRLA